MRATCTVLVAITGLVRPRYEAMLTSFSQYHYDNIYSIMDTLLTLHNSDTLI